MGNSDLRQRTARGFMWGFLNNGSMQLLGAVFGIILLRLLDQEDYGKIAMLTVFSQVAGALQESGFTQALCNLGKPTHRDYNSVFWCNIGISSFLYLLLFFSLPPSPVSITTLRWCGWRAICSWVSSSVHGDACSMPGCSST